MIIRYLRGLVKKKEKPCEHKSVIKENYGGFFDLDKYTCTNCNEVWDEAVIFSSDYKAKDEFKRLEKAIQGGKIEVIKDLSKTELDFMKDDGEGLKIALGNVGKGKSLRGR